jgi:MFS family permease
LKRNLALAALAAADFLVLLDGLGVAVALPAIRDGLRFDQADLSWVVTAYVLVFGGFLLLGGRLADLVGRRRVLLGGFAVFAAGSLVAGLAPTAPALVGGRALQGLGAAAMAPAALALLTATFPAGPERDRALAVWSAAGSLGIPAGALLGGVVTGLWGWRWVLLGIAPAAALAAGLALLVVDESRDPGAPQGFDLLGAVTGTLGLALLILAITRRAPLPLVAAVALLIAFVVTERRSPAPLVRPDLFRGPGLVAANLAGAALPVGLGAVLFLGTQHLQGVLGFTALQAGLAYLALSLPVVAASPIAARLVARFGRRPVAVGGFLVQAAGLLVLLPASGNGLWLGFALVGAGAPAAFVPVTGAAVAVPDSGLASGVFNASQQVGNALALALLAVVGYGAGVGLCLLGAVAALRLRCGPGPDTGGEGGDRRQGRAGHRRGIGAG